MSPQGGGSLDRLGSLVELLTNLDRKIMGALDSLEVMRARTESLEAFGARGDELVGELRARLDALDARLNADLDELKVAVMAKLGDLDVAGIGGRFDRLERAVFNIERATVNLDRTVEGGLEALPDFMQRRIEKSRDTAPIDGGPSRT